MSFATFNQIFFWTFIITNAVFYSLFFWKFYQSYRAADSKKSVIVKAAVSFIIWLISTLIIVAASAAYFYGDTIEGANRTVRLESATVYLISFITGWILIGAALIYWISHPPEQKNYGSN
ncbi:MAG: hypothetical protein ACR2HG_02965 [Pyrinomonadaceae bacterium]